MLRAPYRSYERLYTYHLDLAALPAVDDPDLIGAWPEGQTIILFFHKPKDRLVAELCRRYSCRVVYQADLDYLDWENGGEIRPFTVGTLRIAPAWDPDPADIHLDPSVIFGNGFHPTTRLCLEALARLAPTAGFASALDLGCGTAILAIAAAKLGISTILGVDENRLAIQVAQANIAANKVEDRIRITQADLRRACPPTQGVDLVIANLHQDLLAELFRQPDFWQARQYILSGFLKTREKELLATLPLDQLQIIARDNRNKWGLWVLGQTGPRAGKGRS